MDPRLDDAAIARALESLPGWERRGDAITKTFAFPAFLMGIAFVARVAHVAEEANHHPDMDIRYTSVTCSLSTHDSGGITSRDLALARAIDHTATERP